MKTSRSNGTRSRRLETRRGGATHIGHPQHGFYNGLPAADNTGASTRLGIHNWAESGIAGRGVLLDVARFFAAEGREFNSLYKSPGLAQREATLRWLWDHEIAVVASDTPAVEADPVIESDFRVPGERLPDRGVDHSGMLHRPLIALLGMAMGELWKLDELAAHCAEDGRYDFFLTCKPLNIVGGVGCPPNPMAIK